MITIRKFTLDDTESTFTYSSDFENTHYMLMVPQKTVEETREFLAKCIDEYEKEVQQRWGDTNEYKEYKRRGLYGMEDYRAATQAIVDCFVGFGAMKEGDPASEEAKLQAKQLQDTITANYYPCSKEILAQLGTMYTADERFTEYIDQTGGEGTAEFASKAIENYCKS